MRDGIIDSNSCPDGWLRRVGVPVIAALFWLGFSPGLWWLDRYALGISPSAYSTLTNMVFNAAPGWLLALLLVAVTRRLLFPILLVSCLHGILYIASKIKLAILGSPFGLPDFYFLRGINKASIELFFAYVEKPGQLLGGLVGVLLVLALALWIERPRFARFGHVQWALLALSLAAAPSLNAASWPWTKLYTKEYVRPSPLSQTPAVLRSGLVTSVVYNFLQASNMRFDVDTVALIDAAALARPLQPAAATAATEVKPDIIVILSESFMDPHALNGMDQLADSIPIVRRQVSSGDGGALMVPTYGGGTVRTEFEVLTGMPVAAFPEAYYPYVDFNLSVMPSLPSYLKTEGYRTMAVHGNAGSFWNRTNTYSSMGIDRFVTARDFREKRRARDGTWYSDEAMTDVIMEGLSEAPAGTPSFVMAVSIQNHGPYVKTRDNLDVRDPVRWEAIQLPEGLQDSSATEMRNYLYSLQSADQQLGRLLQELDKRGRPYVLAFFGDHLPALGGVYSALGFTDGRSAEQQYTPWVISSSMSRARSEKPRTLHAWQIPSEVLSVANLHGDDYFNLTGAIGRAIERNGTDDDVVLRLRSGMNAAANRRIKRGSFEEYVNAQQ